MKILDGKATSAALKADIRAEVEAIVAAGGRAPHLAAILVGDNGASVTYVNNKVKSCHEVGFKSSLIKFPESVTEEELLAKITELNADPTIDGFIVQLPLPRHINEQLITESIAPEKDVDGFHPVNMGALALGQGQLVPATPAGIIEMLERYDIATEGRHAVVVGRSNIVGIPVSLLLSGKYKKGNCTVTICHSKTQNLKEITRQADILVAAIGVPGFIKGDMVKEGVTVIDVGITRVADESKKSGFSIKGDVDYDSVAPKCEYITPVPGGVGPMTIAMLMKNTLTAMKIRQDKK
ncbi:MAG: bifunctional 5,10-methylenetetrahydrofolate dehydrogenase/5,10-methenyltetrahydrofolate cyclohydrolase [Flavobacteriales bacterium]|jgi:methylenetetrahydrofolate dehydrogenase (NADP+)/methenyltetrahydrofolate cyclohydrolase|nr:bifunctional 5,10-methylenetetrahydrofolate dehydrogenase/5,10-methenyltetrahydrofolate cyclohydrolase [Flavobacteriales bacterium]